MTHERQADAVIVAAGSSSRMGGLDKLEADLAGRSVLRWAVEAMAAAPAVSGVIVVTAPDRIEALRATPWLADLDARVVAGGSRRQESVAAGVAAAEADVVLVHDAARPFASIDLIGRVVEAVSDHGAAIPVLPVSDALKRVDGERVASAADRSGLFRAQTPQGARTELLAAAADRYAHGPDAFADEAEMLARHGINVWTVPGEASNIKVTVAEDLALARRLVSDGPGQRVAQGSDCHSFGPEDGLRLGGLEIEGAPRLLGHSDGDVVLHALADAFLAAAGMGDLGRLFPSGQRRTRGIDSRELLSDVMARLATSNVVPTSADVTILAARPRLGGERLDAMAGIIAELTRVPASQVSVKAATGNLSGDEGAGRAVSATCLVSVVAAS